jgi:hypothetical protein
MDTTATRRTRCYLLSLEDLLGLLSTRRIIENPAQDPSIMMMCPVLEPLPPAAVILSAQATHDPYGIELLVEHPSFDPVPMYERSPRFPITESFAVYFPLVLSRDETRRGLHEALAKARNEKQIAP